MIGGSGGECCPGTVITYIQNQSFNLGGIRIAILLLQQGGSLFGHQVQYETEKQRRALPLDQVKAQPLDFVPGTKLMGGDFGFLFLSAEKLLIDASVYGKGIGGADNGFLQQKKAEGKIRCLGFSFHDNAGVLDRILTEHPEAEFVQIQLNYLDWEDERVQSRKCYETIRRHGKQVVVMEPVKGGKLAQLPEEAAALLKNAHPDWSPASWAVRFAASLEGVLVVLSGMSNQEQMEDNSAYMQDFQPLNAQETGLLEQAAKILSALPAIPCTACRYCVDGCPVSIPIPEYFALYNEDQLNLREGRPVDREAYQKLAADGGLASACVGCRQCEHACPQHLNVTGWLERVAKTYEGQ